MLNEAIIDFDLYSSVSDRQTLELALQTWKPAVSQRLKWNSDGNTTNRVFLMHPGIPLSTQPNLRPQNLALLDISINTLIASSTRRLRSSLSIYLYDSTRDSIDPTFLGAADIYVDQNTAWVYLQEIGLENLRNSTARFLKEVDVAISSSKWTVVAVALENTFQPSIRFIILAGKIILVACLALGLWIFTYMQRTKAMNDMRRRAESEKSAIIVQTARQTAKAEQELNDYIAHEVRNPLAAAMSACSFVKIEVNEKKPLVTEESIQSVREDVGIIESSLNFINDLLRNMLDMHKAASKNLNMQLVPMDMLHDILRPAAAMLYQRDAAFEVRVDCPENLVVMTDRLRLKQVVLNLGRNSTKFVRKGYIKLGASVVDNEVHVYVEDSGPGIPLEKRAHLFAKFQESLDSLDQGTGIGLSLCKHMMRHLKGEIWLDESFDSGLEGFPGSRFVMNLKIPPLGREEYEKFLNHDKLVESDIPTDVGPIDEEKAEDECNEPKELQELPDQLSVLFVDDDLVLRKLFTRSVRKVVPGWNIQEAANGETAVRLAEEKQVFDLIFMDQYMASVQKQMLGSEATRELRNRGVTSLICGLSANDVEKAFKSAGADFFMFKPFPCEKEALKRQLQHLIYSGRTHKNGINAVEQDTSDTANSSSPDLEEEYTVQVTHED